MIDLRDMELLLALSRERHFARAASAAGISQPALSMRLRNIEADLGVPIVRRGNRFEGFTPEGDILLRWARQMLDDARTMGQEINAARGAVVGRLNVGTIPTAMPLAARIPAQIAATHPGVKLRTFAATSLQVQQGIDDGTYDVGFTYEDGLDPDLIAFRSLYKERYSLVVPKSLATLDGDTLSWADIGALPLSLLVSQMQNRRILDGLFAEAGVTPNVVAETNAFSVSIMQAQDGFAATILPDAFIERTDLTGLQLLELVKPTVQKPVALIYPKRTYVLPVVQVLLDLLDKNNLLNKQ